ncbi:uncharacterized protein CTHT_0064390 [Thermochaetoides thermophila DSM 1495]|uniref:Uncharacterized protein n=1 Tax=Chaetomium thermophilum (strain DSM 1495 / CBS 144.50 / IMI 039719) TaxID=759272 RepID=G0SEN6_CHATD|nr:hypothetical protein CTHT_0064390 [Thermochaetoides thermophila DSM 1495]EGS18413.1 hypothetical protein CTHT_0064390 [Thermochaetoides thermophila DSM 1495]
MLKSILNVVTLAAITLLHGITFAAPIAELVPVSAPGRIPSLNTTELELLPRQSGEGIHLMNCNPIMGGADPTRKWTWVSAVFYCPNDADCSRLNYSPDYNDVCIMKTSYTEGDFHRWEGGEQSCRFPTGVTFKWGIIPNAQAFRDYSHVGSGSNGYRDFRGYKDNKGNGANMPGLTHSCKKIYYFI